MFAKNFSKIKKGEWSEMTSGVKGMSSIGSQGGILQMVTIPVISRVSEQIKTTVTGLLAPLTNEILAFVGKILASEGVSESIMRLSNSLSSLLIDIMKLEAVDNLIEATESWTMQILKLYNILEGLGVIKGLLEYLDVVLGAIDPIIDGIERFILLIEAIMTRSAQWGWSYVSLPIPGLTRREIVL